MTKQVSMEHMAAARAMPYVKTSDIKEHASRIALRRLPDGPQAPAAAAAPRPKKTEAERAMRSKASLLAAARRQGLRGAAQMNLTDLAKALSN